MKMHGISLKIMNNENLWRKETWIFIFPNVFKQGWEFERNPPTVLCKATQI
jgi:hypothetical protein